MFFQTKLIPSPLWNAIDYVIQFKIFIAHFPKTTQRHVLCPERRSILKKLVLTIREEVETTPIEVKVHSTGVSEEEQVFFTKEDNETEEHIWELFKTGLKVNEAVIQ